MATVNKTAVFKAFDACKATQNEATKRLRTELDRLGLTVEAARPLVIEWASVRYACPTKVSTSARNRGAVVLDSDSAAFIAADKAARRMLMNLIGDADAPAASGKREPAKKIRIARAEREALDAFIAAVGGDTKRAKAIIKAYFAK